MVGFTYHISSVAVGGLVRFVVTGGECDEHLYNTQINYNNHHYYIIHVVNINLETPAQHLTHIHILHPDIHKSFLILNLILQPKFLFFKVPWKIVFGNEYF